MLHSKASKELCLMLAIFMVVLAGCSTTSSKSFTFSVPTTGDAEAQVKVTLDTSKGHNMSAVDGGVVVTDKEGTFSMEGVFVGDSTYNDYVNVFNNPGDFDNIVSAEKRSTAKGQPYYSIASKEPGGESTAIMFTQVTSNNSDNVYVLFSCEKTSDVNPVLEAFDLISFS